MKKKIGLFFGCFNPIHNGHLAMAEDLLNTNEFEKIVFVPSLKGEFKGKEDYNIVDFHKRCDMIVNAIRPYKMKIDINTIENMIEGKPYTYKVMEALQKSYPNFELCLIIGADNFDKFFTWKNVEEILKNYEIYVMPRHNYELNQEKVNENTEQYIKLTSEGCIIKGINYMNSSSYVNISSTEIRERISNNKYVNSLLPLEVLNYIKANGLYKENDKKMEELRTYISNLSINELYDIDKILDREINFRKTLL